MCPRMVSYIHTHSLPSCATGPCKSPCAGCTLTFLYLRENGVVLWPCKGVCVQLDHPCIVDADLDTCKYAWNAILA